MWTIKFSESVLRKDVKNLPKDVLRRLRTKLDGVRDDPFRYLVRLTNLPYYKLRVGDYRVIFAVDSEAKVLRVLMIDHRRRIYKRLWKL